MTGRPDTPAVKDYQERRVPVVDPKGESQGAVTLRFYSDMPTVAQALFPLTCWIRKASLM